MTEQPETIENLMKVTLNLKTGVPSTADDRGLPFEFIYGVGPSGIAPFEKALFGKGVGDRIQIDVAPGAFCETVGHLEFPLREQTGITAPVKLQVSVVDVVKAQDREVIKAMAAGGSCGDCGCGCGGH
jgi:hypothetical protein